MRCLIITSNDALDLELDNDWKLAGWDLWAQIETNCSFPDFSSVLDFISKSVCFASTRDYGAAWAFYWTFAPHGSCVSCRHYVWKLQYHRSGDTRSLNDYWSCCQVGPKWISNPLFIITKPKSTSGNQLPQYSQIPLDIHQHVKCLEMSYFSTIYIMPLSAFVQILLK